MEVSNLSLATTALTDLAISEDEIERLADAEQWDPRLYRRVLLACKTAPELSVLARRLQRSPIDSSLPAGAVYSEEFENALQRFVEIIMEVSECASPKK